jgi:subtilase family serine protease
MSARHPLKQLAWGCTALLLFVKTVSAQEFGLPQGVTLPPGLTAPAGSLVLNPYTTGTMVLKPASSQEQRPGFAHTNILLAVPHGGYPRVVRNVIGPPHSGYLTETPASLACIYKQGVTPASGCNPNVVTTVPSGGARAIAIVDAYDYPTAAADLATFNSQFGIAAANFTVIYGTGNPANGCVSGTKPPADPTNSNGGWNIEAALDIEMAHSMAPNAKLFLVEANSNSLSDLLNANQVAAKCLLPFGGGPISNSWGASEFSGETAYDSVFNVTGVYFIASAGDSPGPEWPCTSPNVVCVGGTSIARNGSTGSFLSQSVWNSDYSSVGTGGGLSAYEPRPAYQDFLSSVVGSVRGVPDVAAVADPVTGVWIYNSNEAGGWITIGGTSVAAPLYAGMANRSAWFWATSYNANKNLYSLAQQGTIGPYFSNVNSGVCGKASLAGTYPSAGNPANDPQNIQSVSGFPWSSCVGLGTPKDSGSPN